MAEQLHGPWDSENWRDAPGVRSEGQTNSALAPRDYLLPCRTVSIGVIKGYHLWWCSTHHQPLPWCEAENAARDERAKGMRMAIEAIKALREPTEATRG